MDEQRRLGAASALNRSPNLARQENPKLNDPCLESNREVGALMLIGRRALSRGQYLFRVVPLVGLYFSSLFLSVIVWQPITNSTHPLVGAIISFPFMIGFHFLTKIVAAALLIAVTISRTKGIGANQYFPWLISFLLVSDIFASWFLAINLYLGAIAAAAILSLAFWPPTSNESEPQITSARR